MSYNHIIASIFGLPMFRLLISLSFVLIIYCLGAQETFPNNGAPVVDNNLYVLKGATVHADHVTTLRSADVWIKNGRILAVQSAVPIPSYAIVKDCKGKHIYPSFIDLYSDYGLPSEQKQRAQGPNYERSEKGVYGWNEAVRPEMSAVQSFKHDIVEAEKLRNAGFGAVLTHFQDGIIRGGAAVISLSEKPENESIIKDRAAQFMSFDKGTSSQDYPKSKMGAIALIRQTMYDMEWYVGSGKDREYNLSLSSLKENSELPQFFVTKEKNDILRAARLGQEFDISFMFIGSGNEYERAQDIKAAGGMVVLPLVFPEAYDMSDPFLSKHVSLHDLRHWEQAPSNAAYLSTLGVEIAFTTDGMKDPTKLLESVRICIAHGLSEEAALKALTLAPAMALGLSNEIGKLSTGALANLLIADGELFDKSTSILENWTMGVSHPVTFADDTDISGIYDLNLDGKKYSLEVKGETASLRSKVATDTSRVKVSLEEFDRQVNLSFEVKDRGLYRLHGNINRRLNIWSGLGDSPSGKVVEWNCIRKGDADQKKKDSDVEDKEKLSVLSYPNNGYGWRDKPASETLLITNATVWTNGPQGIMQDTDVLISKGKILAVGHNIVVADVFAKSKEKPNVKTLDAYGKHVTSGIIDEHSHIAISSGVNEGTQASSAEVRIGDVVDPEDLDIYYQLAGGVTASQLLHGSANPIGGQSALIKLRWGLNGEELKVKSAPGFIKFALGENVKQSNWGNRYSIRFPQTRMGVEQVFYDHFHRAEEYHQAKNSLLLQDKKKRGRKQVLPSTLRTDLELEALSEILYQKRFITCHSYVQSEINMLMHVADSMGFTVNTFTHILEGYKVADKMKQHGAGGSTFSDWWAYKYEVREATPFNAALMAEQGVTVAINSDDAEMGRRLNQEAAKGVKYGRMTEEEAWKMVTLNPAKLLRVDDRMGSVEVGKDADIVLWSDNPLSVYAKAEKTFVDGVRYYDMEKDVQLREEIKLERVRLIQKMMNKTGGKGKSPEIKEKHRYHCDHIGP
jgi:imidazolonepropionase-like amidohydrolase